MADFLKRFETCPVCDSPEIRFELKIHYWREYPLDFSECRKCGACFANPMPANEVISDGNEALVRLYQQGRTFENEFRDARQAYLRGRLLAKKLSRWKKKGKLLDLGCYNGFLPLGIRDHSEWEVEGLEISVELSKFIRDKLGIVCHQGTLETLRLPANQYDFIICHDLIEHINQPHEFLREIWRVLKTGGRIQIITPNAIQDLSFAKRAYRAGTPLTMLLNHILYFSPRALRTALEKTGLEVRQLYGYDIRYALKDFGFFGMGQPKNIPPSPSMRDTLKLGMKDILQQWDEEKIAELRRHKKVSPLYGFFKETLPKSLTIHVPESIRIGHELYALAEKRP